MNPTPVPAEKSLPTRRRPSLDARRGDLSQLPKSGSSPGSAHLPPSHRQQEMLLERRSFSWTETSPSSLLLIPFVLIFPFRARRQLCLGLQGYARSCDEVQRCLPATNTDGERERILSHVTAGNVSGILCWSPQTNCICRHAVFVQLIKHVLKPA